DTVVFKVEAESRKLLPKPSLSKFGSVELTSVKRISDEIDIAFSFTLAYSQFRQYKLRLWSSSSLISSDGKEHNPVSGIFGGNALSGDFTDEVDCIKGEPVNGSLIFSVKKSELVIPVLKINIGGTYFLFTNVPIE
ncbi:MAG: hypothetical protein ACK4ON_14545, partial [Bacteroidia bacterium]